MEVELKLLVEAQYRDAILQHPLFNAANTSLPREQKQLDRYFDTPEKRLHRRRIGLRVRRIKNRWVQNIKAPGQGAWRGDALLRRGEWEWPVAGPVPELERLRDIIDDKAVRRDLSDAPALQKRLTMVFASRVKRTVWDVRLPEGGQIECALDLGTLECGERELPISELELELKAGDARQLFDLALGLQQDIPMHLGHRSKAERGYALLEDRHEQAVKAAPLSLPPHSTVEQAAVAIVSNCLAHMQDNDQRVAHDNDVESLHQMRVGMRRLRSALALFKDLIALPPELQAELDWLAAELGGARDWDVLAGATLPAVARKTLDGAHIGGVQQAALEQAHVHHERTAAAIDSPRYARMMLKLSRWVVTRGWREDAASMAAHGPALAQPVRPFARKVIRRGQRRLQRRAANLKSASPAARHRLRIAAKKSRYATEFFASLFPARAVRRYVKGLSQLQETLGLLNDFAVAERLMGELAHTHADMEAGLGFVRGVLAAEVRSEDRKARKLWKMFAPVAAPC